MSKKYKVKTLPTPDIEMAVNALEYALNILRESQELNGPDAAIHAELNDFQDTTNA